MFFRFSSKIFDVQPLDCRHVGCDGPHCDCVIPPRKSQKLAECKCSYSSKSSLIKVPEDISWKLPNVKKCILITLVFFLMNLPVYIDWYLRNHKNLRKRRKGMKKKVTVVSITESLLSRSFCWQGPLHSSNVLNRENNWMLFCRRFYAERTSQSKWVGFAHRE